MRFRPGIFAGTHGRSRLEPSESRNVSLKPNSRTRPSPYGAPMRRENLLLWLWAIWMVILVAGVAYLVLQ
jgi:hypothetical protein